MPREAAFSDLLREQRRTAGYSQEELAERAGLSVAAVASLEQGLRRKPYRDTVKALADALGLPEPLRRQLEELAARARMRQPRGESGIPVLLTSFVQRAEIDEIEALLADRRLLTVTGTGGIGKTRAAIEVARRVEQLYDEVRFIDLLPMRDGSLIVAHIAARLGVQADGEVGLAAIVQHLRSRRALIVIDNCEHVIGNAAAAFDQLLQQCPALTILATSRESLSISGELAYRLSSMTPKMASDLLVARAQSADPKFFIDDDRRAVVLEICRELEGIPLAIELAASRVATLGLDALRARLKSGINLTGPRTLDPRHQTMSAAIAWSFDLLTDAEKVLFRRLGAFAGRVNLDTVEDVCAGGLLEAEMVAETMSQLVAKSLVVVDHDAASTSYRFLEPIRAFAWERLLQSGELEPTMRRLLDWLVARAASLESDRSQMVAEAAGDLDNVRFAVRWSESTNRYDDIAAAAQIVIGYSLVWYANTRQGEKRILALSLLDRLDDRRSPEIVGRLIQKVASMVSGAELLVLAPRGIPLLTQSGHPDHAAYLHVIAALVECDRGSTEAARMHLADAAALLSTSELARTYSGVLAALHAAYASCRLRDLQGARAWLERVPAAPGNPFELDARIILADIEFREGNVERAIDLSRISVAQLGQNLDANRQAILLFGNLASYLLSDGDVAAAEAALRESLTLLVKEDDFTFVNLAICFAQYAAVFAARTGRAGLAVRLLSSCRSARELCVHAPEYDPLVEKLTAGPIAEQLSPEKIETSRSCGAREDLIELIEEYLA
jgi:predicted ATPase/DNA-binding XRE family transcriptional regulator